MKTTYLVKKNVNLPGTEANWIVMNTEEFLAFKQTDEGKERAKYLFQLSKCSEDDADIYAEVDRETFTKWRVDDNHRDYLVKVNKEMGYKVMSYHEAELELDDPNGEDVLVDESCNVEEEVLKKIEIDKLYDAMQKLSESDQELIRVFFFSEKQMTFREYAAITKIPSQTINFRTLRACKRLKKLMEN